MKKIKILVITTCGFAKQEGISTVILDYFSCFDMDKFDVDIVVSGEYDDSWVARFQNIGLGIKYTPSRKQNILRYIKSLCEIMTTKKYDILYIHGSSAIMSIELFVAKVCGCKTRIAHSHNITSEHKIIDSILRPLFYRLYTHAFACGKDAGKWLFGKKTFQIVRNGRDTNKYSFNAKTRQNMRENLELSDTTLAIGHVGNFNKQKNQEFVLNVFKELHKFQPDSRLYLMGRGMMFDEIKQKAKEMNISDSVVFTGTIDNVHEMLQAMDVMLLPSLYEGLPLVVVEWQIAALPCVISDNITKECAYSDLVYFMSLEENYKTWALKLIEISEYDRETIADKMIELTRENGFDIILNAKELQDLFISYCKG